MPVNYSSGAAMLLNIDESLRYGSSHNFTTRKSFVFKQEEGKKQRRET